MNEYIVLFADDQHAERAGLQAAYLTTIMQVRAVRLVLPFLPWGVIRESVSYAHLSGNHYLHQVVSDDYSGDFLRGVVKHATHMNLTPIQINQW
jgi:hypothetical protein